MLEILPNILIAAASGADTAGEAGPAGGDGSLMSWPLMWITQIGVIVLVLGVVLCLWRMIKGPHLADRVLAGDTVAMLVAGLVVVLAIKFDSALFFDAALVVAILGFVSTVAFAQYIGAKNKSAPEPGGETEEQGL
ncbi:MAG: monovalent cation/H+ antiporter complex subunit F [Planctomycetota bacterium]